MAFELVVNGKAHRFILEAIERAFNSERDRPSVGSSTKVVLYRQKRAGREYVELISADLSTVEGVQGLKPGEFYLRDYNQRDLVDALVDQELIEPVAEYSPVQSGYVNFWVYRITPKGLKNTIHSVE